MASAALMLVSTSGAGWVALAVIPRALTTAARHWNLYRRLLLLHNFKLFRLFLSYAITVLAFCCTLMTNLETPIDTLWDTAASSSIHTISVVLPCANESFVERTVESIRQATPKEELLEIIIVDDASWPPVTSQVSRKGFLSSQLRIIRQVPAAGLIRSKKRGADAAKGDAIIFLDCHVRPMPNWTLPLLSELRANPRRIAVPLITGLNPDTWEEMKLFGN